MIFAPVHLLVSEGARQDGATFNRSVREKREMDATFSIVGETMREFHANHDRFFRNVSTDIPGIIGRYTKYAGWRWNPCQLSEAPTPTTGIDPAFNYHEAYDINLTGMDPLYRSFDEEQTWSNTLGLNEGVLPMRNYADQVGYPRYTMPGPGRYYIQDPTDTELLRVVQTPMILAGETLRIDTHQRRPTARLHSGLYGENSRNVWAQLKGRRWLGPLPAWSSTDIVVRVEGGSTLSKVTGVVTPRFARPS